MKNQRVQNAFFDEINNSMNNNKPEDNTELPAFEDLIEEQGGFGKF